jgi:hypothetical protein
MRILGIFFAAVSLIFGFRLVATALYAALSGKLLVRQGVRTRWVPAPTINDAWKAAFRDGLMGVLLILLGIFLLT